jgi:hypothetical protein
MNRWAIISRPLHGLRLEIPLVPAMNRWAIINRPFHGLRLEIPLVPAMNRWAIISRPLVRTTNPSALYPSSELLGYYQPSAGADWDRGRVLCKAAGVVKRVSEVSSTRLYLRLSHLDSPLLSTREY